MGKEKKRSCLVVADTVDTTVVSAVSATTRHDRHVPNHFLPIFWLKYGIEDAGIKKAGTFYLIFSQKMGVMATAAPKGKSFRIHCTQIESEIYM